MLMDFVSQYHKELEVEVFEKNKIGRKFYHRYGFKVIKEYQHSATGQTMMRLKYRNENV